MSDSRLFRISCLSAFKIELALIAVKSRLRISSDTRVLRRDASPAGSIERLACTHEKARGPLEFPESDSQAVGASIQGVRTPTLLTHYGPMSVHIVQNRQPVQSRSTKLPVGVAIRWGSSEALESVNFPL